MPLRAAFATVVLAVVFAGLALACSGAAREGFDGSVYRRGNVVFQVPPPPASWKAVQVTTAALGFRDATHDASVMVNARCTSLDRDTPLLALTSHLLLGTTERDVRAQAVIPLDGREALHTELVAKLDGVPIYFDVFVLKKDGCIYDFVYFAPAARGDAGAGAFRELVRGFRTLPGAGAS